MSAPREVEFVVVPDEERPRPGNYYSNAVRTALLDGKTVFVTCADREEASKRAASLSGWARTQNLRLTTRIRDRNGEIGVYAWVTGER